MSSIPEVQQRWIHVPFPTQWYFNSRTNLVRIYGRVKLVIFERQPSYIRQVYLIIAPNCLQFNLSEAGNA